jgi:hypothetical protein
MSKVPSMKRHLFAVFGVGDVLEVEKLFFEIVNNAMSLAERDGERQRQRDRDREVMERDRERDKKKMSSDPTSADRGGLVFGAKYLR